MPNDPVEFCDRCPHLTTGAPGHLFILAGSRVADEIRLLARFSHRSDPLIARGRTTVVTHTSLLHPSFHDSFLPFLTAHRPTDRQTVCTSPHYDTDNLLLLLVFSPWAGLGRDQSSVRRLVWLWYAASWASS